MVYVTVSPSLPVAGPDKLIDTSALVLVLTTDPLVVALLLAELPSGLLAVTAAVLLNAAPLARFDGADTISVNESLLPDTMFALAVTVTLPLLWLTVKA